MEPGEIDLPDPFGKGGEPSPISNDELLSQLAGKEIERLLGEVDQQLDAAVLAARKENPAPALALRKYPQLPPPRQLSGQEQGLMRVLGRIEDRAGSRSRASRAEESEDVKLLGTPVDVFERVAGVGAAEDEGRVGGVDLFPDFQAPLPLPVALRPLAWINAPFDGMSQMALSALGKVAIVSFVSAVAMLVYVVVITR